MKLLLTTIDNCCIKTKLSLKYLYGVIADSPLDVEYKEFSNDLCNESIYSDIVLGKHNIVYFHVNSGNKERINHLCELIKKAMPTSVTVVGGMATTFNTEEFMLENPSIDFVIRGEGELVFFNFIKNLVTYDFDFGDVAGLAYREGGDVKVNPLEASIRFEDIPFPYEKLEVNRGDIVGYESMRGAIDRCAYAQFLPDAQLRSLPLNRICSELKYFIVRGASEVHFVDKWFNYNPQKAYRIWEYIINNDNGEISFFFDIDGDVLDEEQINLLKGARKGLFVFNVDIESTNPEALDSVGRKANIYQLLYNLSRLIAGGTVTVNVNLKAGLPFDTPKLFARAFNKAYGLGADRLNIDMIKMKEGTLLRKNASRYGYIYDSREPFEIIRSDFLKPADVIKIKMIAMLVSKYSFGFEDSIKKIRTDLRLKPYNLFSSLAEYVMDGELIDKLNDKADLYRLIYSYATSIYDASGETLQLPILMQVLESDMKSLLNKDEFDEFKSEGWKF